MEKIFQDKVALVTGGSFGIGQAAQLHEDGKLNRRFIRYGNRETH